MIVTNIRLLNFRNYIDEDVSFVKGINVITGLNGAGKTNLVEAIDYCSLGSSFRNVTNEALIRNNEEKGRIIVSIFRPQREEIDITLFRNKKVITLNGDPLKRVSELQGHLSTLVFTPQDVNFFNESASVRRRFLDKGLSERDKAYLEERNDYEKILKERNLLLKEDEIDTRYLSVLTEKLVSLGKVISEKRDKYIRALNKEANNILELIAPELGKISLEYEASLPKFYEEEEVIRKIVQRNEKTERIRQHTLFGPHRDDLKAKISGNYVDTHASQGEKRLIALSLKLSPYNLVKTHHDHPVVILDDVLSELDNRHQDALINYLRTLQQVFITATTFNERANAHYEISENHIRRTM